MITSYIVRSNLFLIIAKLAAPIWRKTSPLLKRFLYKCSVLKLLFLNKRSTSKMTSNLIIQLCKFVTHYTPFIVPRQWHTTARSARKSKLNNNKLKPVWELWMKWAVKCVTVVSYGGKKRSCPILFSSFPLPLPFFRLWQRSHVPNTVIRHWVGSPDFSVIHPDIKK